MKTVTPAAAGSRPVAQAAALLAAPDDDDRLTAIQAHLAGQVSRLAGIAEALSAAAAQDFLAGTFVELGRQLERQETAGRPLQRRPRHRSGRPCHLRVLPGGRN